MAFALWRRVSDTRLWANSAPAERAGLFDPTTPLFRTGLSGKHDRTVTDALETLGFLVRFPDVMRPSDAAVACRKVYEWADAHRYLETAVAYAEAWAYCAPECAKAAAEAGQMCMRAGYESRAAVWLYRAGVVAGRTQDEEWAIRSKLRTGILLLQLGRSEQARAVLRKAGRRATRAGQVEWAGKAHHDLLLSYATDAAGFGKATAHLEHALRLYPVRNARIPYLVHDYAVILIRSGAYGEALRALGAVYPYIPPSNRTIIHATTARACAGVRDHDGYARGAALVTLAASKGDESASFALLHVAEGARLLGEWDSAESHAAAGLQVALRRRELDVVRVAYDVLDAVTTRTQLQIVQAPHAKVRATVDGCLLRLAKLAVPSARQRSARFPASQVVSTSWVP
jgi:tetratricopeptide (TPR) repeat protein